MVAVAILVIVVISKKPVTNTEQLSPALVLPFVGTTTDAVVGGLILNYSDDVNSRLAIPVIIVSYMLVGIGFFVALMIYSAYFIRLTNTGLPPAALSPSLVLLVGPCGQSSAALQLLGQAAMTHFGRYGRGTFLTDTGGSVLAAAGDLLGLMLTGMGLLFAAFATYVILEAAVKRQCKYSLLWWSTIFPMATINTAFISFAESMDSPTFRVLATGLLLLLVIDYLINWAFTIRDIAQGKLLNGRRSEQPAQDRIKRR
jgi:tellurite resistance protein TehA-like permease